MPIAARRAQLTAAGWTQVAAFDDGCDGSMLATAEAHHAVWASACLGDDDGQLEDIYLSTSETGASWSEPVDLTKSIETDLGRIARRPRLARSPAGELILAYESEDRSDPRRSTEVRVVRSGTVGWSARRPPWSLRRPTRTSAVALRSRCST